MSSISLPRTLVNQLLRHAQQNPEREVCGLISGADGGAVQVHPIANVAGDPGRLFEMEPKAQIDAMRKIREQGHSLFAIYHSHPHSPPVPSAKDLADAGYPDALYLIISLSIEGVLQMSGYYLRGAQVEAVDLTVEN